MRSAETWFAIFGLGVLGLTWPVIEVFRGALYLYLLAIWLLLVALVALASRRAP